MSRRTKAQIAEDNAAKEAAKAERAARFHKESEGYRTFISSPIGRKLLADGLTRAQLNGKYAQSKRVYVTGEAHHRTKHSDAKVRLIRAYIVASKHAPSGHKVDWNFIAQKLDIPINVFNSYRNPLIRKACIPSAAQIAQASKAIADFDHYIKQRTEPAAKEAKRVAYEQRKTQAINDLYNINPTANTIHYEPPTHDAQLSETLNQIFADLGIEVYRLEDLRGIAVKHRQYVPAFQRATKFSLLSH
ncbi:hypothetical protein [Shewanella sp. UCD-KL21]|uniref:hypothetical protein n=1 Tax=Shewanella sp. UCD-KL21 TaxID=1917164 RepID=UPI0009712ACD|nr:hypothetical protein [Shewanella sp. UCD-KL21]